MSDPNAFYHLEYAQRDFLGLTDEPMEFSEKTIASVLEEIITETDFIPNRMFLRSLVRALRGEDIAFRLKLVGKARGKFKSAADQADEREFQHSVYMHVLDRQIAGDPKEAAVASAAAHFKISRANVFKQMRDLDNWNANHKDFIESLSKILKEDPFSSSE